MPGFPINVAVFTDLMKITPTPRRDSLWFRAGDVSWRTKLPMDENDALERLTYAAQRLLGQVTFPNFWTPVELKVDGGSCHEFGACVVVTVRADVRHRDAGTPEQIDVRACVPAHVVNDTPAFLRAIRAIMVEVVCGHEVDEAMHFRGVRVDDPHAPGREERRTHE